jgi:hypothetical protein
MSRAPAYRNAADNVLVGLVTDTPELGRRAAGGLELSRQVCAVATPILSNFRRLVWPLAAPKLVSSKLAVIG